MARRKSLAVVAGAVAAAAAGALLLSTAPHTAAAKPEAHAILIDVRKLWYDEEGKPAKPGADSVRVRVKVDAVEEDGYPVEDPWYYLQYPQGSGQDEISEEGPDGVVGTDDDWTIVLNEECGWGASIWFRNSTDAWPKLRGVEVEELDVPDGYASEVSTDLNLDEDDLGRRDFGYIDVINRKRPSTVSVDVAKRWNDGDDERGIRPSELTVHLLANGEDTGRELELTAAGPDGAQGTADDWTSRFEGLEAKRGGSPIEYTVSEDMPEGYRAAGDPEPTQGGFVLTNELVPVTPVDPAEPGNPDDPSDPVGPVDPGTPDVPTAPTGPGTPDDPADPAGSVTTASKKKGGGSDDADGRSALPKTGDTAEHAVFAAAGALAVAAGATTALRRREERRR